MKPAVICHLCRLNNSEDEQTKRTLEMINNFIIDSVNEIHMGDLVDQIHQLLQAGLNIHTTKEVIYLHIREHMLHQKVVMTHFLKDLITMGNVTSGQCVTTCEDTGVTAIDHKNLASYLRIIDSISGIYRSGGLSKTDGSLSQ